MKKIEKKKNYISFHNLNDLKGINEAIEFFNSFCKESISVLKDFYNNQVSEKVHGFVYRECLYFSFSNSAKKLLNHS